jgi:hypothetical protein
LERSEDGENTAAILERWLCACPDGPLALGPAAEPVLEALAAGWSSTVIHALAAQPRMLSETIAAVAPEARKDAIHAIRALEEVELLMAMPGPQEKTLAVTEWLRRGIGPLAAAARLETAEEREDAAPIDPRDVEAAFLLTLPLTGGLADDICSSCRLTVPMPDPRDGLVGVVVQIEWGRIVSVSTDLTIWSDTYASGPPLAWIETLIDPSESQLDAGGALEVPIALVEALHEELFSGLGELELRS